MRVQVRLYRLVPLPFTTVNEYHFEACQFHLLSFVMLLSLLTLAVNHDVYK